MYLPAHFKPAAADVQVLLATMGAADLVTLTADGLLATMLPLLFDPPGSRPDAGELGSLVGHLARANRQWREPALGEALAIIRGPDAYVTPAWYATKREHGRVVPTWNYVTVHAYGRLVVHDDLAWVDALVRRLTARHESGRPAPWSPDDAPPDYLAGQLRAIVGVELVVSRMEAKFKLSQNRSTADVDGAIAGFEALGDAEMAAAMRATRR